MRVTLQSIAEATGADPGTVSRVLRGQARKYQISEKRERLIRDTAQELGYRPNQLGRALRSGRNCDVGLVMSADQFNWLPGELLGGIQDGLQLCDYTLRIARIDLNERTGVGAWETLLRRDMIDGLLVAVKRAAPGVPELQRRLDKWGRPVVWLSNQQAAHFVEVDTEMHARQATQLMIAAGHRRVAYIGLSDGNRVQPALEDYRRDGYEQAMTAANLAPKCVPGGNAPHLQESLTSLLGRADRPSAMICHNDSYVVSALIAAAANGLSLPTDLSILSLSKPYSSATRHISHYTIDEAERGRESVALLRGLIEEPAEPPLRRSLRAELDHEQSLTPPAD